MKLAVDSAVWLGLLGFAHQRRVILQLWYDQPDSLITVRGVTSPTVKQSVRLRTADSRSAS